MSTIRIIAAIIVAQLSIAADALSAPAKSTTPSKEHKLISNSFLIKGQCEKESGVSINNNFSNFNCNTAILTHFKNGNLLVQFLMKGGNDDRILGFSGKIQGNQSLGSDIVQTIIVERIYLDGSGSHITSHEGSCFINWSGLHREGGKILGILCGSYSEHDRNTIKALAGINTLKLMN